MQKVLLILATVVLVACTTVRLPAASASDEANIRAARGRLDDAFAKRQFALMNAEVADDVSWSGPVARTVGRSQLIQSNAVFADRRPDQVTLHTPQDVRVNSSWLFASESGEWRSAWLEKGVLTELRGTYFAFWRKVEGRWLLNAHVYVSLSCKGGSYCNP